MISNQKNSSLKGFTKTGALNFPLIKLLGLKLYTKNPSAKDVTTAFISLNSPLSSHFGYTILKLGLIIILLFSGLNQAMPQGLCINVNELSNIEVTWNEDLLEETDNNQVSILGSLNPNDAFNILGTENISNESFLNNPAFQNPENQPLYFKLQGLVNGQTIDLTEVISTVHLTNGSTNNYEAILNFSVNYSNFNQVVAENKETTETEWSFLTDIEAPPNTFTYIADNCDSTGFNFRIKVVKDNCISFSNEIEVGLRDLTAPSIPEILSVSVDTTNNQSIISWRPSPELDTEGYNIVRLVGGATNIIGVNTGRLNTTFLYAASVAGNGQEFLSVQAFDQCIPRNTSPTNPNFHTNIYLQAETDICTRSNILNWNAYENWANGVERYEVYFGENGFQFQYLGETTNTSFSHENISLFSDFCYIVKAIKSDEEEVTSMSNKFCINNAVTDEPVFCEIESIVSTESGLEINILFDQNNTGTSIFQIERAQAGGEFISVGNLLGLAGSETFIDINASNTTNYRYRISIIDECELPIVVSNTAGNIVLSTGISEDFNQILLDWRALALPNLINQEVFKIEPEVSLDEILIETLIANARQTTDDISEFETIGLLCYRIEAITDKNGRFISNQACTEIDPIIYTPNTLRIGGKSGPFKPVITFASNESYRLLVFNRLGEILFETNDLNKGWDGFFQGKAVPLGVYVWQVSYRSGTGKFFEKSGKVTVIK
jgi:gliding motility-associated-like protein